MKNRSAHSRASGSAISVRLDYFMQKAIVDCRSGQRVRVKSWAEIRCTLDQRGDLQGMPFMPEMLQFCGREFGVSASAHKTCDTATKTGGRRLDDAVHLDDLRCDGKAHGGCEADCLLFWKTAWLESVDTLPVSGSEAPPPVVDGGCAQLPTRIESGGDPVYRCQATTLPGFTRPLPWWDFRQYVRDVTSGNRTLSHVLQYGLLRAVQNVVETGVAYRLSLGFYNWLQGVLPVRPGPYPKPGTVPPGQRTPEGYLDLQPGEWVRVKPYEEIRHTIDRNGKNRGMRFDIEMIHFCGQVLRVRRRVNRILDEGTGKLIEMKNPCIILDGSVCRSAHSRNRMFCPRALPSYWRELWLERAPAPDRP